MVLIKSSINLLDEIAGLFVNEDYHKDVALHCRDGIVQTNRLLLAAASRFWREMLSGLPEDLDDVHVQLENESAEDVKTFTILITKSDPEEIKRYEWSGRLITEQEQHPEENIKEQTPRKRPKSDVEEDDVPLSKKKRKMKRKKRKVTNGFNDYDVDIKLEPNVDVYGGFEDFGGADYVEEETVKNVDVDVDVKEFEGDHCSHVAEVVKFLGRSEVKSQDQICLLSIDDFNQGQIILGPNATLSAGHQALHLLCRITNFDIKDVFRKFSEAEKRADQAIYGVDADAKVFFRNQDELEELEVEIATVLLQQAETMPAREIQLEEPAALTCNVAKMNIFSSPLNGLPTKLEIRAAGTNAPNEIELIDSKSFESAKQIALVTLGKLKFNQF